MTVRRFFFAAAAILIFSELLQAQQPPATVTLTAKLRDMHECIGDGTNGGYSDCTAPNANPDFETEAGCPDTGYVAQTISTTGDVGDTTVFPFDNRTPVKTPKLAATDSTKPCYTSVANFDTWYNDRTDPTHPGSALDINRPFLTDLTFTYNTTTNSYEYNSQAFFPLDSTNNPLQFRSIPGDNPNTFGNLQPSPRNNHDFGFTMEFHSYFTYLQNTNQVFSFAGDDDVWVFVNGQLVIDLGGVHSTETASINLDQLMVKLGLVNNQSYILDFFFAERHSTGSHCMISTSLHLQPVVEVVTKPPVITPADTTFNSLQTVQVTITPGDTGATIHYTTDGSAPDSNSTVYTGPITVSSTETIKAVDTKPNQIVSSVTTGVYTQTQASKVGKPVATPPGSVGTSPFSFETAPLSVALTDSTPGAVIYYSFNGSTFAVGTALSLTQSGALKAYATKTGMYPSDTLVIQYIYAPPARVVKAWYLDANGDGSIDEATVVFNQALPVLPAKLDFKIGEANNVIEDRPVSGTDIAFSDSGNTAVLVTFATPFKQGVTSLGAGTIGQVFAQSDIPLLDGTFAVEDSVPPVILSGTVYQPDSSNALERVVLTLSEASVAPTNSQSAFMFKRALDLFPAGSVVVDGIQKTDDMEYTLLIDSTSNQPPIVGDSAAIATDGEVKDVFGNAPIHRFFVRLGGTPAPVKPVQVYVLFPNGKNNPGTVITPDPTTPAHVAFIPIGSNGIALPGNDNGECGSCWVGNDPPGTPYVGPILNLVIPGPMDYTFQIFSNLGEFVVSGSGKVQASDLPYLQKVQGGAMYLARFIWTGRSAQGAKAGTGAYILQCTIHTQQDPRTGASASSQIQRILFGFIRQNQN